MLRFVASKLIADKELLLLRRRLGGTPGTLSTGGTKVEVLRLGEGLYASAGKVPKEIKMMSMIQKQDVHPIITHTDAVFLGERIKVFGGLLGEKA